MDTTIATTDWLFKPTTISTHDPAEEIYDLYPKKVGKPFALRAIRRALKEFGFERLAAATRLYRERSATMATQFIPHPSTWFNQNRFNDDPSTWNPSPPPPPHKLTLLDKQIARVVHEAINA